VASCLVCSSPDRPGGVRTLAGDIVLCYCARHFTLTVPGSPRHSINGYRRNNAGGTLRWTSVPSKGEGGGGVEILLVPSCDRNQDNLLTGGALGSYADLPLPLLSYYNISF